MPETKNHLADATSPYLQQHADNPVQWYPWGPQALALAREENKPILLSIGYSACHWCHVMAHESFEDEATAELMNRLFINIKVDREERPDLDKIYQTAHQLLTQRNGGWPLTMFLMPQDHVPFFGGTYFPPEARYNMPSFRDVMTNVEHFYRTRMQDLEQQNDSVRTALAQFTSKTTQEVALNAMPLDVARQQLEKSFDQQYAGFGDAPKFPHPTNLEFLLDAWVSSEHEDEEALQMVTQTLHAMASGGVYDQVGGGFYRYSVDERWQVPHFEKMLYDNGPLLSLYCQAFRATQSPVFKRIARETADWVMREMQSPDGAYYSTLDADTEGEEGKYYIWTPDEVRQVLGEGRQFDVISRLYGLDGKANFEGKWHFNVRRTTAEIAEELDLDEQVVQEHINDARQKLFAYRESRIRPGRDEKILTSWNGLMIKGMVEAGRVLNEEKYINSATRALDFIRRTLWKEKRLLATCKDGVAHLNAYLDDYVMLADAVLELLQARWCSEDLAFAVELMETVLQLFEDKQQGGLFFTASDHEQLLMRLKPYADDALPSGNGIAASVLLRLGQLIGDTRYSDAARRILEAAWEEVSQLPYIHNALLQSLSQFLFPGEQLIVRIPVDHIQWQSAAREKYAGTFSPQQYILAIPDDETVLTGALADYKAGEDVVAYVCKGFECQPPVTGLEAVLSLLDIIPGRNHGPDNTEGGERK